MISKILSKVYDDDTSFSLTLNGMRYYPCINGIGITRNISCNLHSIRNSNTGRMMLCNACQLIKTNELRCTNRLALSPSRKIPINSMSSQDISILYNSAHKEQKVLKQKYSRLIARLECKKSEFIIEDESSAKKIMQDVLTHLRNKYSHTTYDVTKLLMDVNF